jgi:hypothetical protein
MAVVTWVGVFATTWVLGYVLQPLRDMTARTCPRI